MKAFLLAGEASGDRLGAALIRGLRSELGDGAQIRGVGGEGMRAEGMDSLFAMEEISVMGVAEILREYPRLRRRLNQTVEAICDAPPDVLVTIDLPEFGLRVARAVKARRPEVRTVHYVAPTVWAWRPGRAAKMAPYIDQVLALFPFEPPYMEAAGMRCDFVGHPVVTDPQASPAEAQAFRDRHGLGAGPVLLVLPGSRRSEVTRLAPVFGAALRRMAAAGTAPRVVVPAAPGVAPLVQEAVADWPGAPLLLDPRGSDPADFAARKRAAFRAADGALAASGTVALELAAAQTPMVVAYDMGWLSRQIIGRMLRTDSVNLVNLVAGTRSVPELIGPDCAPEPIAAAVAAMLRDPGAQLPDMARVMELLGKDGPPPGLRAARAVIDGLARG